MRRDSEDVKTRRWDDEGVKQSELTGCESHRNRHISTPVDALVRRTFSATQVTSIEPSAVIAIGPDVYNGVIVRDFLKAVLRLGRPVGTAISS